MSCAKWLATGSLSANRAGVPRAHHSGRSWRRQSPSCGCFDRRTTSARDDLHQQAVTWTRAISADLGRSASRRRRRVDVAQRLAQIDATRRVFVIFRDGRVIGPAPESVVKLVTTDFGLVPPQDRCRAVGSAACTRALRCACRGTWSAWSGSPRVRTSSDSARSSAPPAYPADRGDSAVFIRGRPARQSTAAAIAGGGEAAGEGRARHAGPHRRHDEVAEVAAAFNSMADELERHTTALETPIVFGDNWSPTSRTS